MSRWMLVVGAFLAASGVGIGAFEAHGLEKFLENRGFDPPKVALRLDQCETAVRYQLVHGLGILFASILPAVTGKRTIWHVAALLMLVGVGLFSGGIYGIVFAELPTHRIVPFGGISFILGWVVLAMGGAMSPSSSSIHRD